VHGILTFLKRLTGLCLQLLHHCFVAWTKPSNTALILGTLTDLARSRSELVAENVLLRKPLIIFRLLVKRPACTKTDGMILGLLAKAVRTWKQALMIVREDEASPLVWSEHHFSALLPLRPRDAQRAAKL
jgi:hypothetical protein